MASVQKIASSSDSDPRSANIDEKKRKRMLSNRESARRSRVKKQKQVEDLVNEVSALREDNNRITEEIKVASQRLIEVESSNNVLRARAMELTERLRSLNSVLHIVEDVGGYEVDIPEIPEPWRCPCPIKTIMASADMLDY